MVDAGDGTQACRRLTVSEAGQAGIGACDDSPIQRVDFGSRAPFWTEMVNRFAPFEADTAVGHITFQGKGEVSSPAREEAIAHWAQLTYFELSSGRASAAGPTIMSWWLGEIPGRPGYCRHLTVLRYGYAYASETPCAGGQVENTKTGWLETAEWSQLEQWISTKVSLFQDNNYLEGQGQLEMSPADVSALSDWVEKVYGRIAAN
jgi:hypothetical protein